jgi:uncharacterized protein
LTAPSLWTADYRAPLWLPGGDLQTIWAARAANVAPSALRSPTYQRSRWTTPDGDFIDVDALPVTREGAPTLVLFHGLEGSSQGHYALAMAHEAQSRGWGFTVPHFRGCSGEINRAPRAYHSGDHAEIDWILRRLKQQTPGPLWAVGVSLGGNALLRWAQEAGDAAHPIVGAVCAISAPLDLAAAGRSIDTGLNRWIYARMFLATMRRKAQAKAQQFPQLFDIERTQRAKTLREFDDAFTAPLHGFEGVDDYWARASAKPGLHRIRIPALVINARNDPFVPATSLPNAADLHPQSLVTLWQPRQGGHVGFPAGRPPGHLQTLPQRIADWLVSRQLGVSHG